MARKNELCGKSVEKLIMDKHYSEKACEEFCSYVKNAVKDYFKNHHLCFEISIAWDDDDEFEHEGYYNSVDEAINALEKYRNSNYPNIL